MNRDASPLARRSFLARVGAGAAAFGAAFTAGPAEAQSGPASPRFQPALHGQDLWLEDVPAAQHRLFMDTISAIGFGRAMFYANNFHTASRSGYDGLTEAQSAIVICARHESTPFAYNDAMWAKYGPSLSERAGNFLDPKTKQVPTANVYLASGYGAPLENMGVTADASAKRGVRFAVCGLATRAAAGLIARRTGSTADEVFAELAKNLVPNSHIVPAGIVILSRAQERGYTFSYVG